MTSPDSPASDRGRGRFLILGGVEYRSPAPGCDLARLRAYRGVDRAVPSHPDGFPETHEVQAAFRDYIALMYDGPGIDRFEDASRICAAYNRAMPDAGFEVVEIVEPDSRPTHGRERFGIDIVDAGRNYSHIAESILYERSAPANLNEIERTIWPLARMVGTHFRARLNPHSLFEDEDVARKCLECINALQTLSPGFYETGDFSIVTVFACALSITPSGAR